MSKIIKKLDMKTLEKVCSKTFTKKKVIINAEGQDYEIVIDEKFAIDKLQNLVFELIGDSQSIIAEGFIEFVPYHTMFLILKHFTDIDVLQEVKEIKDKIRAFEIIYKLGIVEQVVNKFDENELMKVNAFIKKAKENTEASMNNKEIVQEYSDLLNMIEDKKDSFFVEKEDDLVDVDKVEEIIEGE